MKNTRDVFEDYWQTWLDAIRNTRVPEARPVISRLEDDAIVGTIEHDGEMYDFTFKLRRAN